MFFLYIFYFEFFVYVFVNDFLIFFNICIGNILYFSLRKYMGIMDIIRIVKFYNILFMIFMWVFL